MSWSPYFLCSTGMLVVFIGTLRGSSTSLASSPRIVCSFLSVISFMSLVMSVANRLLVRWSWIMSSSILLCCLAYDVREPGRESAANILWLREESYFLTITPLSLKFILTFSIVDQYFLCRLHFRAPTWNICWPLSCKSFDCAVELWYKKFLSTAPKSIISIQL